METAVTTTTTTAPPLSCTDCGRPASVATRRNRKRTHIPNAKPFTCLSCQRNRKQERAAKLACAICGAAPPASVAEKWARYEDMPYRCVACARKGQGAKVAAALKRYNQEKGERIAAEKAAQEAMGRNRRRLTDPEGNPFPSDCPPGKLPGTLCQCGPGVWAIRVESNQTPGSESVGALSSREAAVAVAERRGICLLWEES